jgi:hypothetical protein
MTDRRDRTIVESRAARTSAWSGRGTHRRQHVTTPAEMRIVESVLESPAPCPPWLPTHPTPLTRLTDPPTGITLPTTRVRPPGSGLRVVERRRLLDRVSRAVADTAFTLISAPAGYGKTVCLGVGGKSCVTRAPGSLAYGQRSRQPARCLLVSCVLRLGVRRSRRRRCAASDGLHRTSCR